MKIEITEEELLTIQTALQYVSDRALDNIIKNRLIMSKEEMGAVLDTSRKYSDLSDKLNNK